jgi:hypothetical protein
MDTIFFYRRPISITPPSLSLIGFAHTLTLLLLISFCLILYLASSLLLSLVYCVRAYARECTFLRESFCMHSRTHSTIPTDSFSPSSSPILHMPYISIRIYLLPHNYTQHSHQHHLRLEGHPGPVLPLDHHPPTWHPPPPVNASDAELRRFTSTALSNAAAAAGPVCDYTPRRRPGRRAEAARRAGFPTRPRAVRAGVLVGRARPPSERRPE